MLNKEIFLRLKAKAKPLMGGSVFVCMIVYIMLHAWGKKGADGAKAGVMVSGFNMQLPDPVFDKKEEGMDKLGYYNLADRDSIRRRDAARQDPYVNGAGAGGGAGALARMGLPDRDQDSVSRMLTHRLDSLKERLARGTSRPKAGTLARVVGRGQAVVRRGLTEDDDTDPAEMEGNGDAVRGRNDVAETAGNADAAVGRNEFSAAGRRRGAGVHEVAATRDDPELDKLSGMLDKLVALRKGEGLKIEEAGVSADAVTKAVGGPEAEAVGAAIAAEVQSDQVLVNGLTISLRLLDNVLIGRGKLLKGEVVHGKVSFSGERAMVRVSSILQGQSIYMVSLGVYDMDGMEGIRIRNTSGWGATKQAADMGIGSLNVTNYDPSIAGQMANVGIQATKSLFSRRVRAVAIPIRHGYRVMLRDMKGGMIRLENAVDSSDSVDSRIEPPALDSLEPFLHHTVHSGKVKFSLRGIYLRDGLMWFYFELANRSRIDYGVDYLQAAIVDRRAVRSMAMQDVPMPIVYERTPSVVGGEGGAAVLFACRPFTLEKSKSMVVTIGERNGGRLLDCRISSSLLLKAK